MRLGLALGYWGRGPNPDHLDLAAEAENLGYDSVWTAEAWGSDAFTPLTWIAAHTSRIRLGTAIAQMAARTPTATAMQALTLDHLSGGRMMLGLGLSGPQVVEGWYGRPFPSSPLTATREYVDVIRQVLRREAPSSSTAASTATPTGAPTAPASANRSNPSPTRSARTCPSCSAPRAPRTSPRPPASRTAGSRSTGLRPAPTSTRPRWPSSPKGS